MNTRNIEHILTLLSIVIIYSSFGSLAEWCLANSNKRTEMIPMCDGIELATDLYFPKNISGPFPVILMRTPYKKEILKGYGDYFSEHGYVLAVQDVCGRFESQGEWEPFIHEGKR